MTSFPKEWPTKSLVHSTLFPFLKDSPQLGSLFFSNLIAHSKVHYKYQEVCLVHLLHLQKLSGYMRLYMGDILETYNLLRL